MIGCLSKIGANNVSLSNVTYNEVANTINFDLSWDNAFYVNSDWSDHIYIFAKYKNGNASSWDRVLFEPTGHSDNSSSVSFDIAGNSPLIDGKRLGMKAGNVETYTTGSQSANCTALLADNITFFNPSFKVFAIEMVQISNIGNDYYVGDGSSANRFHKGDNLNQPYFWDHDNISSATVGTGPNDINTLHPDGIPVDSIPSYYFRPTNNIMKYEISQQQYVDFLNCLNRTGQNKRVATDISGTSITDVFVMTQTPNVSSTTRNGIRCDASLPAGGPISFYCDFNDNAIGNEYDDGQNIAMNYLSGEDLFAYLDWAGLEPINELQYEQICRGSYAPVPGEFAWGTNGFVNAVISFGAANGSPDEVIVGAPINGPLRNSQLPMRCGAAATTTTTRLTSGGSAYGIMELSGNVAEIVIHLRDINSFVYILNGDGLININATTNEAWPQLIDYKGGYINGDADTVSERQTTAISFTDRSPYYGGRGGY